MSSNKSSISKARRKKCYPHEGFNFLKIPKYRHLAVLKNEFVTCPEPNVSGVGGKPGKTLSTGAPARHLIDGNCGARRVTRDGQLSPPPRSVTAATPR